VTDTTTDQPAPSQTDEPVTVVLQRLVLPADADFDTLPLYVESGMVRPAPEQEDEDDTPPPVVMDQTIHPDLVLGRHSLRIPAGTRASFATYFNAFPASYWRRWTSVTQVTLSVDVEGDADVLVYRSNARGDQNRVAKLHVEPGQPTQFRLPLDQFGDGGWYWFDVVAGMDDVQVEGARWSAQVASADPGRISIGITTFNRPADCVALLRSLGSEPQTLALIDTVFVVDQGNKTVEEDPGFPEVAAALGGQLQVIHQPNLGGSGGFSRSMYETAYGRSSRYVLLLDDDALVEPEGILRAVTFADLCRTPTIVGGHMLNMHVKSTLHAFGERVNRYRFFWGPAPHTVHGHDFAERPLRATRWLHRRIDVDYNGWWMCLIPTEVVRSIGLALPIFIKWDDAEYSLRAREAGIPTVSMPGAAVWHVSWADKDDAIDWQAYHHARNRTLAALLHSPYDRGGRLLIESMAAQVKHALSMQYTTAELRLWALQDILSGPDHLHRTLPTKLSEIRQYRSDKTDAAIQQDPLAFPPVRPVKPRKRGKDPTEPGGAVGRYVAAAAGVVRQFRPIRDSSTSNPEAHVPAMDVRWWLLSQFDSALVSTADGAGSSWYKRDPARFSDLMRRSTQIHRQLALRWEDLAEEYRAASPSLTAPDAWSPTWSRLDGD